MRSSSRTGSSFEEGGRRKEEWKADKSENCESDAIERWEIFQTTLPSLAFRKTNKKNANFLLFSKKVIVITPRRPHSHEEGSHRPNPSHLIPTPIPRICGV